MTEYPNDQIAIELNAEVTAKIDVLVEKGIYPDRVGFLEKAIESQLNVHDATFQELVKKKDYIIGLANYSAKELEKVARNGKKLEIKVIGRLSFSDDVTPELVERSIVKINIAGILKAPDEVLRILNKKRFTILGHRYREFKRLKPVEEKEDGHENDDS